MGVDHDSGSVLSLLLLLISSIIVMSNSRRNHKVGDRGGGVWQEQLWVLEAMGGAIGGGSKLVEDMKEKKDAEEKW